MNLGTSTTKKPLTEISDWNVFKNNLYKEYNMDGLIFLVAIVIAVIVSSVAITLIYDKVYPDKEQMQ